MLLRVLATRGADKGKEMRESLDHGSSPRPRLQREPLRSLISDRGPLQGSSPKTGEPTQRLANCSYLS